MDCAPLYTVTPIKEILRLYSHHASRGFQEQTIADTCTRLANAIQSRPRNSKQFQDYNLQTMYQSWRMEQLKEHIEHGLQAKEYFSPLRLA